MAKKLATIDWHVLTIGENRFRVSSSSIDADKAWQNIIEKVFIGAVTASAA